MALCQHRAQPRGKLAAPMKVVEQRGLALPALAVQAVKFRIERIGEFSRPLLAALAHDSPRRRPQNGPVLGDKRFPGRLGAVPKRARQRQIFQVKRPQIILCRLSRRGRKMMCRAAVKRGGKLLAGNIPARRAGSYVQQLQERRVLGEELLESRDGSFRRHRTYLPSGTAARSASADCSAKQSPANSQSEAGTDQKDVFHASRVASIVPLDYSPRLFRR